MNADRLYGCVATNEKRPSLSQGVTRPRIALYVAERPTRRVGAGDADTERDVGIDEGTDGDAARPDGSRRCGGGE